MRSGDDIDPRLCPLCGKPNQCAMADCGKAPDKPCWCKSQQFSQQLLEQVPKGKRNRACICKRCQQNHATA
jgi:hypothetical protein